MTAVASLVHAHVSITALAISTHVASLAVEEPADFRRLRLSLGPGYARGELVG